MEISPLQKARYSYQPKLPGILCSSITAIEAEYGSPMESQCDQSAIAADFPCTYPLRSVRFKLGRNDLAQKTFTVAVILSGGQAPGGHNVIAGLFDACKKANPANRLLGFLGGPSGLVDGAYIEITSDLIDSYRNSGGFDIIGSGRTKLETTEQFEKVTKVCSENGVNSIVIIGGDDSNTNAAVLAEYFRANKIAINVVGCPKTIDGDLKNEAIEASFGFDTASKTYSELIGNIERDANSAKKYWHFIRLMGRSASHIALECALETQPSICLIGEEVEARNMSISDIADYVASIVALRGNNGEDFGVCLVPEGLIEFVPQFKALILAINDVLAANEAAFNALESLDQKRSFVSAKLEGINAEAFNSLPAFVQAQLVSDRDPHGNVQVSKIETEKLIIDMVETKLKAMKKAGAYNGKFSALSHFFGYEGRCAFPSNFDADYCYSLGYNAFLLLANGLTGYISSVKNLKAPAASWIAGGIPITSMMNMEMRNGALKPVIKKALVELDGKPFKHFAAMRQAWAEKTSFTYPGAIQYWGPSEVCDRTTITLALEH
ncbi:MAG: diphosphate--fructose-6-phosphate 1-phosphotransferase [Sphaerochaetaceae bacterium]